MSASSSSSSEAPIAPPCRSCDVLPLLRLFFQDPLIQPALQLPHMPSEMLQLMDEYLGVDPPPPVVVRTVKGDPPTIYYRGCEHSGGSSDCPVLSTEDNLREELLEAWRIKHEDDDPPEDDEDGEELEEPSLSTLINDFNDEEGGETPWMKW